MPVPQEQIPMLQPVGWNAESFRVGWLAGKAAVGTRKRCPYLPLTHSGRIMRAAYFAAKAFHKEIRK